MSEPVRARPAAEPAAADAFHVGYLDRLPAPLARWLRPRIVALLVAAIALAALLAVAQRTIAPSRFEFGAPRELAGVLERGPYPVLWAAALDRPRDAGDRPVPYLLVGPGKHGAAGALGSGGASGATVRLRGTLAAREGESLLEVEPRSLQPVAAAGLPAPPPVEALGTVTLRGEIVDGKCFLGVMNPGEGKVHRGCAVRCISGGTPPLLVVRDGTGAWRSALLVGSHGESIAAAILDRVAEPVEVRGELERRGELLVLRARPEEVRRIGG